MTYETVAPQSLVRLTSGTIIAELVDAVMQGEPCLALTGPPGCGKTTAAAAIRDDLARRSVRVLSVDRGKGDIIRLRDIASQLVGEPENLSDDDHAEQLFTLMTTRAPTDNRLVLMIDDADVLQTTALEYLRLMSSIPTVVVPQFVFVGRPRFWGAVDHAASGQFKERITARWEIGRLSADMARVFIDRLLDSAGLSVQHVFADDGLAALIRRGDGLFGRIVSLLQMAMAIRASKQEQLLTAAIVDGAAATLDAREAMPPDHDVTTPRVVTDGILVETQVAPPETFSEPGERPCPAELPEADERQDRIARPEPDARSDSETVRLPVLPPDVLMVPDYGTGPSVETVPIAAPVVANRSARWRPYACAAAVALLLCSPATVMHWRSWTGGSKSLPPDIVAATNLSAPAGTDVPLAEASAGGTPLAAPAPAGPKAMADQSPVSRAEVTQAAAASPAASQANPPTGQPAAAPPEVATAAQIQTNATVPDQTAAQPPQPEPASVSSVAAISPQEPPVVVAAAPVSPLQTDVAATAVPPAPAPSGEAGGATPSSGAQATSSGGDRQTTAVSPQAQETLMAPGGTATSELRGDATAPTGSAPPSAAATNAARPAPPIVTPAPPVPAVPVIPKAASAPAPEAQSTADDISRGDAMLAIKDISAARRFYEDAADAGSARAALAMASTYDPAFLSRLQVFGLRPDPALAATWYRKAAALGAPEAEARLRALGGTAAR